MTPIEVKVMRGDTGIPPSDLTMREYIGVRRSENSGNGNWNPHGRRYSIKGLYNLVRTPEITYSYRALRVLLIASSRSLPQQISFDIMGS